MVAGMDELGREKAREKNGAPQPAQKKPKRIGKGIDSTGAAR